MNEPMTVAREVAPYYCGATELRDRLPLRCYLRDSHDGPHRDSVMGTLWWPRVIPPAASQETSA